MNRIGNPVARGIVCAATILCCANVLWAVEFAGGTGEPNDPYRIATAEQLIEIGSSPDLAGRHFLLAASIDVSGVVRSGPLIASFPGTFDGNGHTIQNLSIKGIGYQGLFGRIEAGAEVRNLGVVNFDITATNYSGGLAGRNAGTMFNCHAIGVIASAMISGGLVGYNEGAIINSWSDAEVTGYAGTGGLVGNNNGFVTGCRSTGSVLGAGPVGGLAGRNDGTISSSESSSDVVGQSSIGGLIGENSGPIANCRSTGSVMGNWAIGGLVGSNTDDIWACYSSSDVQGETGVGGLVGDHRYYRISCCYSTGRVTGMGYVGGLVANNEGYIAWSYSAAVVTGGWYVGGLEGVSRGVVTDSYFLTSSDRGGSNNRISTALTLSQMKQQASFPGWHFWTADANGSDGCWFMPVDACPVLAWQTEFTGLAAVPEVAGLSLDHARDMLIAAGFAPGRVNYDFCRVLPGGCVIHADPHFVAPAASCVGLVVKSEGTYDWAQNPGEGTAANPYEVQTPGQLESLTEHPEFWDKCFVLTADLDMAGRAYPTPLIAPDVNNAADYQGTSFTGTFSGRGYSIENLTILAHRQDYVGLFGMVGEMGRINDLHLIGASVRGSVRTGYVGTLVGCNAGTISGCSATGIILTGCNLGDGLAGSNRGTMENNYANVAILDTYCSVR